MIDNLSSGLSIESLDCVNKKYFIMRGHGHGRKYGDPVLWVGVMEVSGDTARISGLHSVQYFSVTSAACLRAWMRERGVKTVKYERLRDGEMREYEFRICE